VLPSVECIDNIGVNNIEAAQLRLNDSIDKLNSRLTGCVKTNWLCSQRVIRKYYMEVGYREGRGIGYGVWKVKMRILVVEYSAL